MPCVPHSANLALVTLFSLHVMGAIPNAGPFVEFSIEDTPWATNYYDPVPKVVDGKVSIPDGPGWASAFATIGSPRRNGRFRSEQSVEPHPVRGSRQSISRGRQQTDRRRCGGASHAGGLAAPYLLLAHCSIF